MSIQRYTLSKYKYMYHMELSKYICLCIYISTLSHKLVTTESRSHCIMSGLAISIT